MTKVACLILGVLALSSACANWKGDPGPKGDTGAVGTNGVSGDNGVDGQSCSVEPMIATGINGDPMEFGGSVITCPNGSVLIQNGATGSTGPQGPQGNPGDPGANGTVITAKNLCPGTPSYPSTFIEVAYCIDHNLYGVYSTNGGFLTLLPPGAYNSNAVGSTCGFTIQPDCVIVN